MEVLAITTSAFSAMAQISAGEKAKEAYEERAKNEKLRSRVEAVNARKRGVEVFYRSYESANNDSNIQTIFEWHDKLPYKYIVIISGCNPLLKIETIDAFVEKFLSQEEDNLFGVIEKKQYYWNKEGIMITPWPEGQTLMNTKAVEPTYEAAHVLYATPRELIKEGRYMGDFEKPGGIKLFPMDELETFDIDYEWQFNVAELLYKNV